MIQLREYQQGAIPSLRKLFSEGHSCVVYSDPCGSGKSIVTSELIRLCAEKGTSTLLFSDREEIFLQNINHVRNAGIEPHLISQKNKIVSDALIQLAMVETFSRRKYKFNPDFILFDEGHRGAYKKIISQYPDTKKILITATPCAKWMYGVFTGIVQTTSVPELVKEKHLVPALHWQKQDLFDDLKMEGDEFSDETLHAHFSRPSLYGGVISEWKEKANGKQTICYNVNNKHSHEMNEAFLKAGVRSALITADTPNRADIFSAFERKEIQVIHNTGIITYGNDIKSIECIVLNCAIGSLIKYIQAGSRGGRPDIENGKQNYTVLDFGGNRSRHGTLNEARWWTVEKQKKPRPVGAMATRNCPICSAMLPASVRQCEFCFFIFPTPTHKLLDGVMVLCEDGLPDNTKGKKMSELSIEQLIDLQKIKKLTPRQVWSAIRERGIDALKIYQSKMKYHHIFIKRQMEAKEKYKYYDAVVK